MPKTVSVLCFLGQIEGCWLGKTEILFVRAGSIAAVAICLSRRLESATLGGQAGSFIVSILFPRTVVEMVGMVSMVVVRRMVVVVVRMVAATRVQRFFVGCLWLVALGTIRGPTVHVVIIVSMLQSILCWNGCLRHLEDIGGRRSTTCITFTLHHVIKVRPWACSILLDNFRIGGIHGRRRTSRSWYEWMYMRWRRPKRRKAMRMKDTWRWWVGRDLVCSIPIVVRISPSRSRWRWVPVGKGRGLVLTSTRLGIVVHAMMTRVVRRMGTGRVLRNTLSFAQLIGLLDLGANLLGVLS